MCYWAMGEENFGHDSDQLITIIICSINGER
jgi:hypothetical protein